MTACKKTGKTDAGGYFFAKNVAYLSQTGIIKNSRFHFRKEIYMSQAVMIKSNKYGINLVLDPELETGAYRPLTEGEIKNLRNCSIGLRTCCADRKKT